jgi:glycine/D-amino acid oxidase-like deaminating enzyme
MLHQPPLFPALSLQPVHSTDAVPTRTDVVIVGGGIVGVTAALALARKGISTTLCEKGVIGGEQSSRNWGWCRLTMRDPAEIPLMIESMRMWRNKRALGGADTGFRTTGIMYLCGRSKRDAEDYEAWLKHARQYQLDSRMLSGAEVARLLPNSTKAWPGAIYTATDGGAEPERAAPAIAEAVRRHGAAILTSCAVRGIEQQAGRVSGVVTERGRIACQSVLVAAGVWSRLFCGSLNLRLPQLKVLASVMRTEPLAGGPETSVAGPRFGWRKRQDGGYIVSQAGATIIDIVPDSFRLLRDFLPALVRGETDLRFRLGSRFIEEWNLPRSWALDAISPFERVRILDPEPSHSVLDAAARNLIAAFPFFRNMKITSRWGGMIDVTPDSLPVISAIDALPGLHVATGFSGHGFGIGPGAGKLAADLISGGATIVDPTPFRFSRFTRAAVAQVVEERDSAAKRSSQRKLEAK